MAKTSQRVRQRRDPKFKTRGYHRCRRCGRPRAYFRKFGLCRICLREAAHNGYVPGMTKSSWWDQILTEPISDYHNPIRNGRLADHEQVEIPASRLKREMSRILKEQGYITDFTVEPGRVGEVIKVRLRYTEGRDPVISGMERVSRPGRRSYVAKDDVPRVFGGMGTTIMSTSRGVMTGHEARQRGVGGEVVAHVW